MDTMRFGIDKNKTTSFRKKIIRNTLPIIIPAILVGFFFAYIFGAYDVLSDKSLVYPVIITSLILIGLAGWIGLNLGIKNRMKIIIEIDEEGLEASGSLPQSQIIPWNSLAYRKKENGDIIIEDATRSKIVRWWSGKGRVIIPAEIENMEQLEEVLGKKNYNHALKGSG